MASIPSSSRHTVSFMDDIKDVLKNQARDSLINFTSQSSTTSLQYSNMRVTQRLHRYRFMKKQWQEVATSIGNTSPISPICESSTSIQDISATSQDTMKNLPVIIQKQNVESKGYRINDYTAVGTTVAKDNNDKNFVDLNPLHIRIQQDLIKLRKLIKTKQSKFIANTSLKIRTSNRTLQESTSNGTAVGDQENNNMVTIRKSSSLKKLKPLDRVKISGCKMSQLTLQKNDSNDSGLTSTSNSSSTCSQYSKQQQQQQQQKQQSKKTKRQKSNKTFNIDCSRPNPPPPLLSDSPIYRTSHQSNRKSSSSSRKTSNIFSKQSLLSPLSISVPNIPSVSEKTQSSFTKQETLLPAIRRLSNSEEMATNCYTYAASSSSATPHSMIIKRNASLLPILLQSTPCIGIQTRDSRPKKSKHDLEEKQEKNNDDDSYYYLLDYKNLINNLPKPVICIRPRYGQDDYGILFEQLDHIRERMPDTNIYDEYARTV
ncbi:unnamed protein product [Rotaria sp. Silwood1]|nr:unnamed protein product [Rotaria sp. Silwood1]CAF3461480.1 unnamed protein product [Rotaria sp. Silwood1]CAF3466828.1 unnamed protein product [Rotaria sp. Silwood1]CAF4564216.1 unnamed protein product [Rotaria sp. Silwood1]CAF4697107.1 unnamed protein product [Rotaria sp. Silwood1]